MVERDVKLLPFVGDDIRSLCGASVSGRTNRRPGETMAGIHCDSLRSGQEAAAAAGAKDEAPVDWKVPEDAKGWASVTEESDPALYLADVRGLGRRRTALGQ